jgi:hypothetical protein
VVRRMFSEVAHSVVAADPGPFLLKQLTVMERQRVQVNSIDQLIAMLAFVYRNMFAHREQILAFLNQRECTLFPGDRKTESSTMSANATQKQQARSEDDSARTDGLPAELRRELKQGQMNVFKVPGVVIDACIQECGSVAQCLSVLHALNSIHLKFTNGAQLLAAIQQSTRQLAQQQLLQPQTGEAARNQYLAEQRQEEMQHQQQQQQQQQEYQQQQQRQLQLQHAQFQDDPPPQDSNDQLAFIRWQYRQQTRQQEEEWMEATSPWAWTGLRQQQRVTTRDTKIPIRIKIVTPDERR